MFYDTPSGEVTVAPANYLMEQLKWILDDVKDRNPLPVGILTSEQRDQWSDARERLRKGKPLIISINKFILLIDPLNQESCDVIENAVYGVCLDEAHDSVTSSTVSRLYWLSIVINYWLLISVSECYYCIIG